MRVGWIRPSWISRERATRAISRRTGSKLVIVTTSGVSSMIRSQPVAASKARMLRPSRPMMRPLISSDGSGTTEAVSSAVISEVMRCMTVASTLRALVSASARAETSIERTRRAPSSRSSWSSCTSSSSRASCAVTPAIRSSSPRVCSRASATSRSARSTASTRSRSDCSFRSNDSARRSMLSSRCSRRRSTRCASWRCVRNSSSSSRR